MTIRVNIKVVPNATPNADGEWLTFDLPNDEKTVEVLARKFADQADFFAGRCPAGHHIVSIDSESRA
jgi:hypothetical protein